MEKEMEAEKKQNRVKYAVAACLSAIVFVIMYKYTLNEIHSDTYVDLHDHIWQAEHLNLETFSSIWLQRPYLLWHLSVKLCADFLVMPWDEAGALVNGLLSVLNCLVSFFIIDRIAEKAGKGGSGVAAAAASGMLSFSMPMYVKWFNSYHYEGQYGINAFFNPTHIAAKPFGLLSFLFAVDLILLYRGQETVFCRSERSKKLLYVYFGAALCATVFAKPTFTFMLLPAGVIYLCVDLVRALLKKDGSWKKVWSFMWRIGCASVPAVSYLLISYAAFYIWGGTNSDSKVAVYPIFTVWSIFSPNIFKSWVFSMVFPIWMVAANPKYFVKNVESQLALTGYLVGTLEYAFLVETGSKLEYCSFAWEMISGMLLVWVVAAARLVMLTYDTKQSTWRNIVVLVGWLLLMIHLFNGTYYINPFNYII